MKGNNTMPTIDTTITISIILAICALFAPSITAWINNRHQYKMRTLELQHDEYLYYSDMLYRDKHEAFKNLIDSAGKYSILQEANENYATVLSAIHNFMLLCDKQTADLLLNLQESIACFPVCRDEYVELLTSISESFNRELSSLSREYNNTSI